MCGKQSSTNSADHLKIPILKVYFDWKSKNLEWLAANVLGDDVDEKRGAALTPVRRMKFFIRYLADPGFQKGIGGELGVEESTVSIIILPGTYLV